MAPESHPGQLGLGLPGEPPPRSKTIVPARGPALEPTGPLALTLWRPWTWAILSMAIEPKRVENRPWAPPPGVIGRWVLLHAGAYYDPDGAGFIAERCRKLGQPPPPGERQDPLGIVGAILVTGHMRAPDAALDPAGWFSGPVGWLIGGAVPIGKPEPCRGLQKLWSVQSEIANIVMPRLPPEARNNLAYTRK